MIDVETVRRDTPSCVDRIHLNNAGASPAPRPVIDAVIRHIQLEAEVGGYAAADQAEADIEDFYSAFANLLNCDGSEIAYAENATRAWDMIFYSVPYQPGDRIITGQAEYASNYLAFLHVAKTHGVEIDVVPNDSFGQLSIERLQELITSRTRLIAITHVPTQGGLVNPAAEIGKVAQAHGILYLLDACQSVGQLPLDVRSIRCDFLTGTGRKFLRGPRGTGFLFARHEALKGLHPPFVDLHAATWVARDEYVLRDDARRFENWESNVAGRIGLARAVRYALDLGLDDIWSRVRQLSERLRHNLSTIPGIEVSDLGQEKCGIVTFRKADEEAELVASRLSSAAIMSSVSVAEYARLDFEARAISKLVRLSVHYFNTEHEIDLASEVVAGRLPNADTSRYRRNNSAVGPRRPYL